MICPSCHESYEEGKQFCRKCGSRLVAEATTAQGIPAKRREFDSRLSLDPSNSALLIEYGDYLLSVNLQNDALACYLKALSVDKDSAVLRHKVAAAYQAKKDWPAAAAQLKELTKLQPHDLTVREELAQAYEAAGNLSDAVAELEQIVTLVSEPLPVLERQRELCRRMNDRAKVIAISRRLLELNPRDALTLRLLGECLAAEGDLDEAQRCFERLLELDDKNPLASLMVGIARHDRLLKEGGNDWPPVLKLLESALASIDALDVPQKNLARLYWSSAVLHGGVRHTDLVLQLKETQIDTGDAERTTLLAWCLVRAGDMESELRNLQSAIGLYERALSLARLPETAGKLGTAYLQKADSLAAEGNFFRALAAYRKAAELLPEDPLLAAKLRETNARVKGKQRKIIVVVCAAALILLVAGLFVYLNEGSFDIQVSPNADKIALYHHGNEIIKPRPGDKASTQTITFGRYSLQVEKEGYEPVKKTLWGPFGRHKKTLVVSLIPIRGAIKADSDPAGATITVQNRYETKTGVTPCKIEDVFALPSKIEVTFPECPPIKYEKKVPAGDILDLGTVKFTGSLKIDSNPTGVEVLVEKVVKGVTPLQVDGLLAKSTHVEVRKENVGVFVTDVKIEPEKVHDLGTVALSNLGALAADSVPAGAKVYVEGKETGTTPFALNNIEVGNRLVRIESPGCVPYEKTITIQSGQVTNLGTIAFVGGVKVDSDPTGAELYIDGEKKGVTPVTLEALPAKDVQLELRIPGKGCVKHALRIKPNETVDLGILKVRGFAGEWFGTVGSNKKPFRLYLKETETGRLSGAGRLRDWDYWQLFEGNATGMEARVTGTDIVACSKNTGQIRYFNLTFAMKMGIDGETVSGKVSGGNDEEEFTLHRTEAPGYSCLRNLNLRYVVQVGNAEGFGQVFCNGILVTMAPERYNSAEVDLTPWLQEGLNRIRYINPHGNRNWRSTFALKLGGGDGFVELVKAEDSGSAGGTYRKQIAIPYFEKSADLQAWKDKNGSDYLEESSLDPVKITASSQFGSDYPSEKVNDHQLETGWVSAAELTIGEWLKLDYPASSMVSGFRLFPLLGNNEDRFARIKRATVECGDKTFTWNLRNTDIEQFLPIDKMPISSVRLRVEEIYPSKSINAVGVSEFQAVIFASPEKVQAPGGDEQNSSAWTKTFRGAIDGSLAIHMKITRQKSTLSGSYYYDKHKTDITLAGTIDSQDKFEFAEFEGQKPIGRFKGSLAQGIMKGEWSKIDGSKQLAFEVTEYNGEDPPPPPPFVLPTLDTPGTADQPGPVINTGTPSFSWIGGTGIGTYGLYISRAPYGEANLVSRNKDIPGTATSFQLPASAPLGEGQYRWNIEAFQNGVSLGYAECRYFQVKAKTGPPPASKKDTPPQSQPKGQDATKNRLQDMHNKGLQDMGRLLQNVTKP